MTLIEYKNLLNAFPREYDALEVNSYDDTLCRYHEPKVPKKETLRLGVFCGEEQWLHKEWVDNDLAKTKDIVLI